MFGMCDGYCFRRAYIGNLTPISSAGNRFTYWKAKADLKSDVFRETRCPVRFQCIHGLCAHLLSVLAVLALVLMCECAIGACLTRVCTGARASVYRVRSVGV